ncbi:hypothetical protein RB9307 [Rhodopirellula baltica SH 1]|uniref:Uncharacterized protein n=1 Tax=Rhodopirellula baltica (strain DSM 10527 / NCIMB 13988 / SH1) TaxID=243090 RepID=Q7ULT1_RHOBA|nr:hypothetical protein RB9307 [Rhodopirellula baltica SH 1]
MGCAHADAGPPSATGSTAIVYPTEAFCRVQVLQRRWPRMMRSWLPPYGVRLSPLRGDSVAPTLNGVEDLPLT